MIKVDRRTASSLKLWVVMNRAQGSVGDVLRRQVESHGLTFTEFAVLEALLHKGTLPIGEIGSRILLTSGSMTYVVDKLEKRGLVRRTACEHDRRIVYAELTDSGTDLIETVFPEHAELLKEVMGDLALDEIDAAAEFVKRVGLNAKRELALLDSP